MKTKELESLEKRWVVWGTLKGLLLSAALLWVLWFPTEAWAKTVRSDDDGVKVMEVTKPWIAVMQSWMGVTQQKDTLSLEDTIKIMNEGEPWIEPDLNDDDKDQGTLPEDWTDQTKEKSDSWVSFSRQTWVWYSVTGWQAIWVNRFVWSGTLFKGKLWEVRVTWIADLDDPLHTKWSWKLILWKSLYKGLSLDWDYTFTWTWGNIFRMGMWYGGQLWDGSYAVKIFPLNTNWSPLSAKVSFSTKVWKNWSLSSFVMVDFDTKWYYSETEYIHQLAQWVAAFVQARLMWTLDGNFTGTDGQILMWWLKINL